MSELFRLSCELVCRRPIYFVGGVAGRPEAAVDVNRRHAARQLGLQHL